MQEQVSATDNPTMDQLRQRSKWIRILYMILFVIAYGIAEFILTGIVIIQVVLNLLTGKTNDRLLQFSDELSQYVYDMLRFLTFNTETMPFPFNDWKRDTQTSENH